MEETLQLFLPVACRPVPVSEKGKKNEILVACEQK